VAATRADLRARATEFAATADATVDLALADALSQINTTNWGSKAFLGQIYLACHFLKVWELQSAAPAGPVSQRKDGDLSESYAVSKPVSVEDYSSTAWGRLYINLRSTVFSVRTL
jgi:hypothetical protein